MSVNPNPTPGDGPGDAAAGADEQAAMRLTGTSFAVLSLLELLGPSTPYDLKQALEQSIENFWPVPHTTFYAEPARLARGGFLSVRQEQGGRRRKLYALTEAGSDALREWVASPQTGTPQLRDEAVLKVFAGGDPVAIFRRRAGWHRAKLAELQGYLDGLPEEPRMEAVRTTLLIGTGYHRMMLDALEQQFAA